MTENESIMRATEDEVREQGLRIARGYLEHRGYEVADEEVADGVVVAYEGDEAVLATVRVSRDAESGDAMPALDVTPEDVSAMRRACLRYAADHDDVCVARADAIAIVIVGEGKAKLRHLVGAYLWEE
jgi:Holliday junction resolvase-like predicted endonuclease